jgi:2,3-diaminopropionate biosynthesis protein SbnA
MIVDHVYNLVPEDSFLHVGGVGDLTRLHLKLEGFNPGGSIKLKTARNLVQAAEHAGVGMPATRLIESSSGNLGVALAIICADKGYPLTCVTDPNANGSAVRIMRALGAEVTVIHERDANGGHLGARIAHIQRRLAAEPDLYWLNQYGNPSNPAAHADHTAPAMLKAFGRVDHLFIGVGTGGTLMGCVDYFRRRSPQTRVIAVDTIGSTNFGTVPGVRHLPGLGSSRRPEILDPGAPDEIVLIPEWESVRECRWLARATGLLAGGSTGTVLAAVRRMADSLASDAIVLAVAPDLGERYVDSIYDDDWVLQRGLDRAIAEPIGPLPPRVRDVLV